MRDLLILLIIFGSLPFILRKPHIGVFVWSWLSYMNPHRFSWGFAYNFPFAQVVAITLFVGLIFSKEKKSIPVSGLTIIWALFLIWMVITSVFAIYPEFATEQLIKVLKIQLVTIFTLILMNTKERIVSLLWVIVMSIGFFGIKGGVFSLVTGGGFRVWGPPGSFIEDNNELAIALLMLIPLFQFLRGQVSNIWIKRSVFAAMVLCAISVLGSQSRGALIAILVVGVFLILKSKKKILGLTVLLVLSAALFAFMPESWHQRMDTIQNYEQDESAMGRINAWQYSINVASNRITGGGFQSWTPATFAIYAPNPNNVKVAHSIYFGVLADHGWIGLFLFLLILFMAWRSNSWIIRNAREHEQLAWTVDLARMLQVSMVAYGSGGAFLSLAYFDLPWHLIAIIVLVKSHVEKVLEQEQSSIDSTQKRFVVS